MNNFNKYDLQKLLVRAYQDPNVISAFMELVYDYFNNKTGVKKISINDAKKYIDILPNDGVDILKSISDIKTIFGNFVVSIVRTKELEYLLSKDPNYKNIIAADDYCIFNISVGMVNLLDISTAENKAIRINLIN